MPQVKEVPRLLRATMEKLSLKQEGVAVRLGVDQPQIFAMAEGR